MQRLITFLGRAPKGQNGYRTTVYDFNDGHQPQPAAFFGWPLVAKVKPDALIILGTSGSMWDHLIEGDLDFGNNNENLRIKLVEEVEKMTVSQDLLNQIAPLLEKKLGIQVKLNLIPYCKTADEQVQLLKILTDNVEYQDQVDLDVTHALRHLPMIGLIGALYLRKSKQIQVNKVWYGAYDPDTQKSTVHDLIGLLHIVDWVNALTTYDKDGDYGVFAPLMGEAGNLLKKAAFFERTSNSTKAKEALSSWHQQPQITAESDPIAHLFNNELTSRVQWFKGRDRAAWEQSLAYEYLEKGDYMRATVYGQEAIISRAVIKAKKNVNDYKSRENRREELKSSLDGFKTLSFIRNALVHGICPTDKKTTRIIATEDTLKNTLKSLFQLTL